MSILKKNEAKVMTAEDLSKKLDELYLELTKEKASVAVSGTVKNPGRIKEIKKTIAKILTLKKQRESKEKEVHGGGM